MSNSSLVLVTVLFCTLTAMNKSDEFDGVLEKNEVPLINDQKIKAKLAECDWLRQQCPQGQHLCWDMYQWAYQKQVLAHDLRVLKPLLDLVHKNIDRAIALPQQFDFGNYAQKIMYIK